MVSEHNPEEVHFRQATSDDALAMVDFYNVYYGIKRKPEHLIWEYNTYEPDKSVFVFAKDHDRLIATQGMLPIYMEIGSKRFLSGKSESTLLLPDYRGSDIMRSLYEYSVEKCTERGMNFLWGFTYAVKAFKKFGFTIYPGIHVMVRPGNIWVEMVSIMKARTPLWRRFISVGKLILKSTFNKRDRSITHIKVKTGYEIQKGEIRDESELSNLYERLKKKNNNIVYIKLDQKYLNWRIRKHPFLRYNEYQVYQDKRLRAYAFVVVSERSASISDLTSEDIYATSLLLYTIIKDYTKKVGHFRFLGNSKDYLAQDIFTQLHQFGFSRTAEWPFVVRDLTGGKIKQIFDIGNWHINNLWTEGYSG